MLFALLNDITPGAVILIPGTSQNLAFSWLVNDDEAQVCPENELDVIQRYVMAVAYYSLGGNNWNICNAQSSPAVASCLVGKRHLSGATVCEWFNVTCADDANVNSVVLGTIECCFRHATTFRVVGSYNRFLLQSQKTTT